MTEGLLIAIISTLGATFILSLIKFCLSLWENKSFEIPYATFQDESFDGEILTSRLKHVKGMRDVIKNHNSLILYGPNGSGKSRFISKYVELYDEETPIIHIKAWEYDRQDEPLAMLLNKIIYKDILTKKSEKKLNNFLKLKDRYNSVRKINYNGMTYVDYLKNVIKQLTFKVERFEIIIDEIDRTKPDFSVEIMEMLNIYIPLIKKTIVKTIYVTDKKVFRSMLSNKFNLGESSIDRFIDKYAETDLGMPGITIDEFEEIITADFKKWSFSNDSNNSSKQSTKNNIRKMKFDFKTFNNLSKPKNIVELYLKTVILYHYIAGYKSGKILIPNSISNGFEFEIELKAKEFLDLDSTKLDYLTNPTTFLERFSKHLFCKYEFKKEYKYDPMEVKEKLYRYHIIHNHYGHHIGVERQELTKYFNTIKQILNTKLDWDMRHFSYTGKFSKKIENIDNFGGSRHRTRTNAEQEYVTINNYIDNYNESIKKFKNEKMHIYIRKQTDKDGDNHG